MFNACQRNNHYAVRTGVGELTSGNDNQEIRLTERNLFLFQVVLSYETCQFFEVRCAYGDLRLVNVTAGVGGRSYMSYQKVPSRLQEFCDWLNEMRSRSMSMAERYNLSFEAHFRLVTIHPWADGNGRMARLIMNHVQFEFGLVPAKVLKEDKGDYINALIATREDEDMTHFTDFMAEEMIKTLSSGIESFLKSMEDSGEKTAVGREKKLKSREKILQILKEHPDYSARKLAEIVGITPKAIEKHLAKLKAEGYIKRNGPDKGGLWIVLLDR